MDVQILGETGSGFESFYARGTEEVSKKKLYLMRRIIQEGHMMTRILQQIWRTGFSYRGHCHVILMALFLMHTGFG